MAENEGSNNLDLEKILQTLASLPKAADVSHQDHQQVYDPSEANAGFTAAGLASFPSTQASTFQGYSQHQDPRLNGRSALQYRQTPPTPQNRTGTPTIDPSTITEWKHGLRCVSKIATQNPNFVSTIRKLIKDQERNSRDWEAGRNRLMEDQKAKRENEQTHRAALSLPGLLENTVPLRTPEREKEELDQYDQKVYRACKAMVETQSSQLKSMGVPFFGVRPDVVTADDVEHSSTPEAEAQPNDELSKKISKRQLLELQRKMLNHLMELYGD